MNNFSIVGQVVNVYKFSGPHFMRIINVSLLDIVVKQERISPISFIIAFIQEGRREEENIQFQ